MNIIEAVLIVASALAQPAVQSRLPQEIAIYDGGSYMPLGTAYPYDLAIYNNGKETLRIDVNGTVTFGEGVTPNEAAKAFAKAMKEMSGLRPACEEPPVQYWPLRMNVDKPHQFVGPVQPISERQAP